MSIDYSIFRFPKNKLTKIKRKKDVSTTNRIKIKELCHYQCVLCRKKGTQIHHIIYKSEDISKIDDLDNLILLCFECHQKVHSNKAFWQKRLKGIREKLSKHLFDRA